ncbi:PREDICTED: beta-1 adrenergic receptor-like [Branchiostoma belcheri]|uniref:Beta-1 adrenergic receptor-like n=1 Tax=Branchiostoma belcheri TaxID=7741 RepID=A0A6P5A905_BRABE|nr:PREDICTED: beta-1 adrenergic receptor-like [Branchiostoma belcheri]
MNFLNESFAINASAAAPVSSESPPAAASPAQPGVIATVAALAIAGNLLILVATRRRETFPSSSRLFIASIACSDLLLGLALAAMVKPAESGEWVYSETAARATAVITHASSTMTFAALAGLNLDRYMALKNNGEGISHKKTCGFLLTAWVGVYTWFIICTVYWVPVYYDPIMSVTTYDLFACIWFTAASFVISCSALAVTMYCVVRILKAVCTPPEPPPAPAVIINMPGPGGPPQNANPAVAPNHHDDRSYAKVVLILTLIQTVMPLPWMGILIAGWLGHHLPTALFWSLWVAWFNTFLDVVVYSVCQKSFRKVVSEMARSVAFGLYIVCCSRNSVEVGPQQNVATTSV